MKASRSNKLELKLQGEERLLTQKLLQVLPDAASSGTDLFINSEFNPHNLGLHQFHFNEELLLLSKSCTEIRASLSMESRGSVGQLYLLACEESANLADHHRRGSRTLSEWLLSQLQQLKQL